MLIIDNRYKIDNEKDEDLQIDKLYRAKDLQLDSDVYIKVIRDNTTIKDTFIANLVDESMMMSNIDCDNVANILDVVTDESKYYIVSEYFNGISLFDLVNKNNITLDNIIFIMKQMVTSMRMFDEKGFYHGGIRLDNILVDENHNIKIYDYCITKANKGVNVRKDNCIAFLSPHQLNINYTDKESDFFTLGIILFDAIFKKMPFGIGKDEAEMLKLIDKGIDWNTVGINNENIALVNIVKKLTRRTEKYNGINEILIDLSNFMYVKADIEENEEIDEFDEEIDTQINKPKNKIFQKVMLLALTVTMLITVITQFR